MTAPCEWNPTEDRPATAEDTVHAPATVVLGMDGCWHLCESCAALPRFARFRRRTTLRRPKAGAA
jgi:hypothetical protein